MCYNLLKEWNTTPIIINTKIQKYEIIHLRKSSDIL